VCCFDWACECVLHLKAVFIPVCLDRLVIFLTFGGVKLAHFSFLFVVLVVRSGGRYLRPFLCHAMF